MWRNFSLICLNILLLMLNPLFLRVWLVMCIYLPILYMHRVCYFYTSLLSALCLDIYCNDIFLTNVAIVFATYLATSENQFLLLKRSRMRRIAFPILIIGIVYALYMLCGVYNTCIVRYIIRHVIAVFLAVSAYIFVYERWHA